MNNCTFWASAGNCSPTTCQSFDPCRRKVKLSRLCTSISATGAVNSSKCESRKLFTEPRHGNNGSLAVVIIAFQSSRFTNTCVESFVKLLPT